MRAMTIIAGLLLLARPALAHVIHVEFENAPLAGVDVCILPEMSFMRGGDRVTGEGCAYLDINEHCNVQGRTRASGDVVIDDSIPRGWIVAKHDRWGFVCQTGSVKDRTLVRFQSTTLEFRIRTSTDFLLSGPIAISVAAEGRRSYTQEVAANHGAAVLQVPVGKFDAWVRAAGFFITKGLKPEGIPGKRCIFEVQLVPMTPIAVTVLDRTTHMPVPGAIIRGEDLSVFWDLVRGQSDTDGKVMLTSLSGSILEHLTVKADGYVPFYLTFPQTRPSEVQVELTPKGDKYESRIESFAIDLPLKRRGKSACLIDRALGPIPKGLLQSDKVVAVDLDKRLSCEEGDMNLRIDGWPGGHEHVTIDRGGKVQIISVDYHLH